MPTFHPERIACVKTFGISVVSHINMPRKSLRFSYGSSVAPFSAPLSRTNFSPPDPHAIIAKSTPHPPQINLFGNVLRSGGESNSEHGAKAYACAPLRSALKQLQLVVFDERISDGRDPASGVVRTGPSHRVDLGFEIRRWIHSLCQADCGIDEPTVRVPVFIPHNGAAVRSRGVFGHAREPHTEGVEDIVVAASFH